MECSEELKNFVSRRKSLLDNYEIYKFIRDAAWSRYSSPAFCERLTKEEEWKLFKMLKEYESTYEPDYYMIIAKFENGNIGFLTKKYNYFTEGPIDNENFDYQFKSKEEVEEALNLYYSQKSTFTKIVDTLILGAK